MSQVPIEMRLFFSFAIFGTNATKEKKKIARLPISSGRKIFIANAAKEKKRSSRAPLFKILFFNCKIRKALLGQFHHRLRILRPRFPQRAADDVFARRRIGQRLVMLKGKAQVSRDRIQFVIRHVRPEGAGEFHRAAVAETRLF